MNLELAMILQEVNRLTNSFEYVLFKHIYRKRNFSVDALAKAGGSIMGGYWNIKEHRVDDVVETFHIF